MILRRFALPLVILATASTPARTEESPGLRKLRDVVVYRDDTFYSAFPSIVRRPDGELIAAFRRAPDPRNFGNAAVTHTDPNSQLVLVRSTDAGETWTKDPALVWAHPRGGLQDPCLLQLDDDSLLCSSYAWALVPPSRAQKLKDVTRYGDFAFLGGTMYRSGDAGQRWSEISVPPTKGEANLGLFGQPIPAYNRGAMCQGKDGRIFWVTAREHPGDKKGTSTHLLISSDRGQTWTYSCPVAVDDKVTSNETSLYETPRGDLMAFMRTANFDDNTAVARSTDGGKSFQQWESAGWKGHPHYALRLPDQRVLLVYGYRHAPFGIRARVLNSECTDYKDAPETILRDDGGNVDLGYPWATMVSEDKALVVYYFNENDGPRYIGGTMVQVDAKK
ncbi:MAG TPA: sialidase family protein [Tepidisphaeraceae bacterium]|nr:sialidase family protein [Tepidisphaeraceae bacterium]